MADVVFPTVDGTRMNLVQVHPAQYIVNMEYTGRQRVTNAGGPALWKGRIQFRACDEDELGTIAEVTAFLASLRGGANTFRIPIYGSGYSRRQGTLTNTALTVTSSTSAGDTARIVAAGATSGITKGDYVTINNRLYIVVQSMASGIMNLSPNAFSITTGSVIEYAAPTLYARAVGELPVTENHGNGFVGPWTIDFIENVS